jgi:phosphoribosyl-ATP pyrophosphohydrolase
MRRFATPACRCDVDLAGLSGFTVPMADTLAKLEQTIAERRKADPSSSYVAKLFAAGRPKIAQKVGEEAVEAVIAAMAGDGKQLVSESADLIFHLAVLLAEQGVSLKDVLAELDRREGTSGIAEKAARPADAI